ncbi:MAG: GNAT family N-acetyltransferase [Pirellulales bacterium]|nr:GNAT family N-acetyltransferase [Pirellulales bacterium]
MQVRPPQTDAEFARYYDLRYRVLRAPWGGEPGSERDEQEDAADHALLVDDAGNPLAVGRLHLNAPEEAQVRYVAVAEEARGRGYGRQIMAYLEAVARGRGAAAIVLNAREGVVRFYEKLGYQVAGPGPTLFGTVKHSRMHKPLK